MLSSLMLGAAAVVVAARTAPNKPHIFFVMVDDFGYYDIGFRNPLIKTPTLDALVKSEAALLERHYVFKYCSPTRRSFLSGRLPPHVGGGDNSASATVDLRMHTIADKMNSAGYQSHMSGKWHAGHGIVAQTPHGRGFFTSLGYFNGACDHYTQQDSEDRCGGVTDLWDTDKPAVGMNGTYGDYMYAGRAVDTIKAHDPTVPLFYYLAMQVSSANLTRICTLRRRMPTEVYPILALALPFDARGWDSPPRYDGSVHTTRWRRPNDSQTCTIRKRHRTWLNMPFHPSSMRQSRT